MLYHFLGKVIKNHEKPENPEASNVPSSSSQDHVKTFIYWASSFDFFLENHPTWSVHVLLLSLLLAFNKICLMGINSS